MPSERKREITIRLEPELWAQLDDKRHKERTKWQILGERLFRHWLQNESLSPCDWRLKSLQEIVQSDNVTAQQNLDAHLRALTWLVRHGACDADERDQIRRETINMCGQHVRLLVVRDMGVCADCNGGLQEQRSA